MAATSRGSATTQTVDPSRLGEEQMGQRPPLVKFWHTGQQVMLRFASTMAPANSSASAWGRPKIKKASRWADLPPIPGRRANCSTSFSKGGGKYSIGGFSFSPVGGRFFRR